jgi:moderate conductance mechanosensitive channel
MNPLALLEPLPWILRIAVIAVVAVATHLTIQGVRRVTERYIVPPVPGAPAKQDFSRRHPKVATITSLVVSAVTFAIYFMAVGLILQEFGISLTAWIATASIIGLAVAFGSQSLVQDIVVGLTLVFSDTFDIGDMIEVSGQVGRVEKVGLRFTRIVNLSGQTIFIPNRNILLVGRFRRGHLRVFVDVQLPDSVAEEEVLEIVRRLVSGMRVQFRALILSDPDLLGIHEAGPEGWRFLRIRFRVWPGQAALIEQAFRPRLLARMRELDPAYADWMVAITQRAI